MPEIVDLEVSVTGGDATLNLKLFLEYVQEEKQLQQFFETLQNYSKWRRDRSKTFNHFQMKYPKLVSYSPSRDEGSMTLCNVEQPSLQIKIVWKVLVMREGEVKPSFDLQPCFHTEQIDKKGFLRKIRSRFLNLLKNLGIEKSIEVIILSIA